VRLWELKAGGKFKVIGKQQYQSGNPFEGKVDTSVTFVSFSSNSNRAFYGGRGGISTVNLSSSVTSTIVPKNVHVSSRAAISNNCTYGLLAGRIMEVWDLRTQKILLRKTITEPIEKKFVVTGAVTPDGKTIITIVKDEVSFWDTEEGVLRVQMKSGSSWIRKIICSKDGSICIGVHSNGNMSVWETNSGDLITRIPTDGNPIHAVAFLPDGKRFICGSSDGSLYVMEAQTGRLVRHISGKALRIKTEALSPDGRILATGSAKGTIQFWDLEKAEELKRLRLSSSAVNAIMFSKDGSKLLAACNDDTIKLVDVLTGKTLRQLKALGKPVFSVTFSADEKYAYAGGKDNQVRYWDLTSGSLLKTYDWHSNWVTSLATSLDGKILVTGSNDRAIKVVRARDGSHIQTLGFHLGWVTSVAVNYDGTLVAGGGFKETRVWEAHTGKLLHVFQDQEGYVTALSFSKDGQLIANANDNGQINCWNTITGEKLISKQAHTERVTGVLFSKQGDRLITSSLDSSVRIWDVESASEIVKLVSSADGEWIAATPDGYYNMSPEGTDLVLWGFPDKLETYAFNQFSSQFDRKDIITDRLRGESKPSQKKTEIIAPPLLNMEEHQSIRTVQSSTYTLNLFASSDRDIETIRIFVNGKMVKEQPLMVKQGQLSVEVPLLTGSNRVTAIAYDTSGFSSKDRYMDILCQTPTQKPNLHILGIGISRYPNLPWKWQLEYAHSDAEAFIDVMRSQEGHLFKKVFTKILTNESATADNILAAIKRFNKIPSGDLAIIYMAGHGVKDTNERFYFLSHLSNLKEPEGSGVGWDQLIQNIKQIKGRTILLLDACHSGSIVNETVTPNDELARNVFSGTWGGVMVFSASKGRQYSLESPDIEGGFGLYTYALVQALGKQSKWADLNGNNYVEFLELVDYVSTFVDKQSGSMQTPWLSRKELFGDFPIAAVSN
jgi:WD40 repeat protein